MSHNMDWHIPGEAEKPKGVNPMQVAEYIDVMQAIIAEILMREWKIDIEPSTLAVAVLAELSKDRRMGEIGKARTEERQEQKTRAPTEKQKAFIAKHCGDADFKGTFEQANMMIDAKMREKGWGKYGK